VDDIEAIDVALHGKRLEHDAAFPQRCNIEFVQLTAPGTLRTRVWERGSGITMACGTGACATVEFLMDMSHFLEKEYGEDYYLHADDVVDLSKRQRTLDKVITDCFEQIVYSINQPTGARNFQSVFWNISYYDRP